MVTDLPEGWKVESLGSVVDVLDNLRKPINSTERQSRIANKTKSELYPYFGATGQVGWIDRYLTDGEYILVGEDGAPFLDLFKGKAYKIKGKTWVNNHAHILKGKPNLTLNNFIFYYLNSINYREYVNGTTRLKLTKGSLVGIPFPVPEIQQQHQIVEKIEELFSELDKGIENLKTAQQQLKVYRQAVLKWAFEGKLTNDNVKDGELPEGWEWVKLRDICDKIQDGSHFSPQVQHDKPGEDRYMYITAKNIRNNYMDFRKLYYVDKAYHDSIYGRCNPEYGDVLLTKDGINTGEVTLNTLKEPFSLLSSVCLFKPKKDKLKAELLKYFIQSPYGNDVILQSMTGTAIKRIILGKIKDAKISLPPLKEQITIVQEIESRLSVCDKMEETITTSLQQAEALRQSILKRAFEGKLVKADSKPVYKPKNVYFYQIQVLGMIAAKSKEKGINHGEMTIAKYSYLLDKIYQIPTYYDYKRWHLGPYPPEIKKAINNKKFFAKVNNNIDVKDFDTLTKYNNPYTDKLKHAINELTGIFLAYPGKERSHQTELFATVCKVIEDIQSLDIQLVRNSMKEWVIELSNIHFKNKAEKFTEEETRNCMRIIIEKGWMNKLLLKA